MKIVKCDNCGKEEKEMSIVTQTIKSYSLALMRNDGTVHGQKLQGELCLDCLKKVEEIMLPSQCS